MSDTKRCPAPLYPCSEQRCAEDQTYPATDLYWYEQERRWVCENCWENLPNEDGDHGVDGATPPPRGETLAAYLARTALLAPPPAPPADVQALVIELGNMAFGYGSGQKGINMAAWNNAERALLAALRAPPPDETEAIAAVRRECAEWCQAKADEAHKAEVENVKLRLAALTPPPEAERLAAACEAAGFTGPALAAFRARYPKQGA